MPESKRLTELKKLLITANSKNDRDKIWNSMETPLVEDGDNPESKLVTFLYRFDHAEITDKPSIYLFSNIMGCLLTEESQLQPVPETDIFYLSLVLPSDLRFTYNFVKIDKSVDMIAPEVSDMNTTSCNYQLVGKFKEANALQAILFGQKKIEIDNRNPRKIIHYLDYDNPGEYYGMESLIELPLAPSQCYVPETFEMVKSYRDALKYEGRLLEHLVQFSDTGLKNIDDYCGENSTRKYWIYLPKGYVRNPEKPYPMILFLDGSEYVNQIPSPVVLDKMIDDQVLPPTIAVYLEYSNVYRGREYDCNDAFSRFISGDFIKLLRGKHQLPITDDPRFITIVGSSMSGLAAFYAGLMCPAVFGNVIAQSPSFESKEMKKFKKLIDSRIGNCKDSFFSLEIGCYETLPVELQFMDEDKTLQAYSSLKANKEIFNHMSDQGVRMALHQFIGGHSTICWRGTLSDRLKEIYDIRLKECIEKKQQFKK